MGGALGWPEAWQSCVWLYSRLTPAQSFEPDRPHPAWPEKEFSVSNFGFWFCVSTSRSSGAGRPQMESQQVAG